MNDARQNVPSLCHYPEETSKIAKKVGKRRREKRRKARENSQWKHLVKKATVITCKWAAVARPTRYLLPLLGAYWVSAYMVTQTLDR